jgi:hypothetical protein
VTGDKTPIAGPPFGHSEPGRPAAGWGPNNDGEFSQKNYRHPSAGWGVAVGQLATREEMMVEVDPCGRWAAHRHATSEAIDSRV